MSQKSILRKFQSALDQFRYSLSYVEALPQLTFLGLIVGLVTGIIIIAFRLLIDLPLLFLLPENPDNFEGLEPTTRVLFILCGAISLFILLRIAGKERNQVSVSHVLDRLHNYQGHMPTSNWWVQFAGGAISIISGQSVGREGPAVHLGAGAASRISRLLRLPNNSRYTLIACGVAAAISASFDTPMAGVLFAMEVILMEYTVVGFVPVILASVTGAALSQVVFSNTTPLLSIHQDQMHSLLELPFMAGAGLLVACAAAGFICIHLKMMQFSHWPLSIRLALAASFSAIVAWFLPEVMGLGYDTLSSALSGNLTLQILLAVAIFKLLLTAVITGLGMPGGIIGPTLVIGACIGGCLGYLAPYLYSGPTADPGFYVIIGMTGMMAAVLNAPMAALVAVLELSHNPNMIFPSMLVIVIACVTTRSAFGYKGIFIEQLNHSGRSLEFHPAQDALQKTGIANLMSSQLIYTDRHIGYSAAKTLLIKQPKWIITDFKDTEEGTRDKLALNAADLAAYLESAPMDVLNLEEKIDLLNIPGRRLILSPIHEAATLWEALEAIRTSNTEALYVAKRNTPLTASIRGIITEEAIKNYYQP